MMNIRDSKTGASVLPQYNMLNVMYALYEQVFERIKKAQIPDDVKKLMDEKDVTTERIKKQLVLVSELIDGLYSGKFKRTANEAADPNEPSIIRAMRMCEWDSRFDSEAMYVFDILTSRAMLAYWYTALFDIVNEQDVAIQSADRLRQVIDKMAKDSDSVSQLLEGCTQCNQS